MTSPTSPVPEDVYVAAAVAFFHALEYEDLPADHPFVRGRARNRRHRAVVEAAFAAGYDHHRRTCDITNPRGWTSEQIREMERRSAELDKLIDQADEEVSS